MKSYWVTSRPELAIQYTELHCACRDVGDRGKDGLRIADCGLPALLVQHHFDMRGASTSMNLTVTSN